MVFDGRMAWHESWHLTRELLTDPTSHAAAAVADWSHPLSREGMALLDLFDLLAIVNSGRRKPRPVPRPWDPKPKRMGKTNRSRDEVIAILASRGHGTAQLKRDRNGRLHGARGRFMKG